MIDSYEPLLEEYVAKFEREISNRLPDDYRSYLLKKNGGKPNPKRFSTVDGKVESMVALFFSLSDQLEENLRSEFQELTLARQLPANLLSIGKDPADNRILISIGGRDFGAVYYWSWDEEPTPSSCSYTYVRKISDSFQSFVESLR